MMNKIVAVLGIVCLIFIASITFGADEKIGPWKELLAFNMNHATDYAGFFNEKYGITVAAYGEVHYTYDSGKTWPRAENSSLCRFGLDIVDEKVAWHCGNGGHIRVSTDGAKTWQQVTSYQISHMISFIDAKYGWTANTMSAGETVDGAQTWKDLKLSRGIAAIAAIRVVAPKSGYLLDSNGKLYFTRDGGASWGVQSLGLEKDVTLLDIERAKGAVIRFRDAMNGIIVCAVSAGKVIAAITADGGKTWSLETVPGVSPIQHLFLAPDGKTLTVTEFPVVKVFKRE